jgi:SAM-dependent methyltransferase
MSDRLDVHAFADLWEHVRLLSDGPRNEALIALLRRRAPGNTVVEVGCGTGLLSCIAARLGARRVIAIEPTAQVEVARALVEANGLSSVVDIREGHVDELQPEPADLVFGELLNADPFAEGLLDAWDAAAEWVGPDGHLAPHTLRLHAAWTGQDGSAAEVSEARRQLERVARTYDLRLDPVTEGVDTLAPYAYLAPAIHGLAPAVEVLSLPLGRGRRPPEAIDVAPPTTGLDVVRGLVVWFTAELDDGLVLGNPPDAPGHWGHLVLGLPDARPVDGEVLAATLLLEDGEVGLQLPGGAGSEQTRGS